MTRRDLAYLQARRATPVYGISFDTRARSFPGHGGGLSMVVGVWTDGGAPVDARFALLASEDESDAGGDSREGLGTLIPVVS